MAWPINVRILYVVFGAYTLLDFPYEVFDNVAPLLVLLVGSSFVFILLYWADAYERESIEILVYFLLWGALVSTTVTSITYSIFEDTTNNLFIAATIEEVSKLIFFIFLLRNKIISWWTDGLVAGGLIGLGFTVNEDLYYLAIYDNSVEFAFQRTLYSIFAHSFFTGIAGALIAYLWISHRKSLIFIPILIASVTHFIWNYSAFNYFENFYSLHLIIPPLMMLFLALFLRANEKKILERTVRKNINKLKWDKELYTNLKLRKEFRNNLTNPLDKRQFDEKFHKEIHKLLFREWKKK